MVRSCQWRGGVGGVPRSDAVAVARHGKPPPRVPRAALWRQLDTLPRAPISLGRSHLHRRPPPAPPSRPRLPVDRHGAPADAAPPPAVRPAAPSRPGRPGTEPRPAQMCAAHASPRTTPAPGRPKASPQGRPPKHACYSGPRLLPLPLPLPLAAPPPMSHHASQTPAILYWVVVEMAEAP